MSDKSLTLGQRVTIADHEGAKSELSGILVGQTFIRSTTGGSDQHMVLVKLDEWQGFFDPKHQVFVSILVVHIAGINPE